MTPDDKRLKEIDHKLWELEEIIKQAKKETKALTREKLEIQGLHKVVRAKQKYRSKGKVRVRK